MALIKSKEEVILLREGGKRLAEIRSTLVDAVEPGVTTAELDRLGGELFKKFGGKSATLNYTPSGAHRPFPAEMCISVNDEIVHGIPTEDPHTLKRGDIISFDILFLYKGLITDTAITVPVGAIPTSIKKLLNITQEALTVGIKASRAENTVGDIGHAIETFMKPSGFGIVRDLCGHGVGHKAHEDPQIPNYGPAGAGMQLEPGMVLAIEPMFTEGAEDVVLDEDGYTVKTADGKLSAHFEHTIVITEGVPEILTK